MGTWQRRKDIMLCYPFEESRFRDKWGSVGIVQPKLDGIRCRALISNEGEVSLISSEGNLIESVPHIIGALMRSGLKNIELDGELYRHGLPFESISSIVMRTKNLNENFEDIQYHVFDYISDEDQLKRLVKLGNIMHDLEGDTLRLVPSYPVMYFDYLMSKFDEFISDGYEGFVVRYPTSPYIRKRVTTMMKFKPKKEDIYEIVGCTQEIDQYDNPKHSLGALVCRGSDMTAFNVGTGFTADERANLWRMRESLIGKYVLVKYQHITSGKGVPRFPVYVKIIETPEGFL